MKQASRRNKLCLWSIISSLGGVSKGEQVNALSNTDVRLVGKTLEGMAEILGWAASFIR